MSVSREPRPKAWDDIPWEPVTEKLSRRLITGDRIMLAHVHLEKGSVVPQHSHENEQFTYVLKGVLRFWVGASGEHQVDVREGGVLHLPSNVPHKAEALEDTLDMDIFSPPRSDWLDGTDSYFHEEG